MGNQLQPLIHTAITLLAFVGAPAVIMAILLTTRPRQALALRRARPKDLLKALILAAVVLGPLVQLTLFILQQLEMVSELVQENQRIVDVFSDLGTGQISAVWAMVSLVLLPAVCEELAFRGFILTGLRRRLRPWTAIGLSSFLFALYHMNVFQFLPTFLLGGVLALLTVRSGSILPAVLFHLLHNSLLVGVALLPRLDQEVEISPETLQLVRLWVTALCTVLASVLLWRLSFGSPLPSLANQEKVAS
jgi:sodium transport system permease protein